MKKHHFIEPMKAGNGEVEEWFAVQNISYYQDLHWSIELSDQVKIWKDRAANQLGMKSWHPWYAYCSDDDYLIFQLSMVGIIETI